MKMREQAQQEPTFKDVLVEMKEIAKMFRETDRKFQETDRMFQESKAEHDRMFAKIDKEFGGVGNRFGDFAEGMLTSDLLTKFIQYGLDFDDMLRNVEINERGTKRPIAELDWLLLNTTSALVGETKVHLTRGDVDKHITRMKKLASTENGLLSGKKLYGAVAGVKMTQTTKDYAKKCGFFVLEPAGDSVRIEAPESKPAVWG
jgi:hypothetical protein